MNNDLMLYVSGAAQPPREDRALVRRAKQVADDMYLTAFELDAVSALGGHLMDSAVYLDNYRRFLADGDEVRNRLLAEIELGTLQQMQDLQVRFSSRRGR